jgi:4-diphosphocytidyl-2-C-methyl-D-erythritol kinase
MTLQSACVELAPAKVNLSLRVLRRRQDGYHDIESLVVFANVGDTLTFTPGTKLTLKVAGPTGPESGQVDDNLVLRAARALLESVPDVRVGSFSLAKRLPVAAGLGGGSADAAAALRLIARASRLRLDDLRVMDAARKTGADVPVCLDPRPRLMRGIGEILSPPLSLPKLPAVLVNPGIHVPTRDVFAALRLQPSDASSPGLPGETSLPRDRDSLVTLLEHHPNDLERPAIALQPSIANVLAALRESMGCVLARMSGSGATCFGLFGSGRAAAAAASRLRSLQPRWWVRATSFSN